MQLLTAALQPITARNQAQACAQVLLLFTVQPSNDAPMTACVFFETLYMMDAKVHYAQVTEQSLVEYAGMSYCDVFHTGSSICWQTSFCQASFKRFHAMSLSHV